MPTILRKTFEVFAVLLALFAPLSSGRAITVLHILNQPLAPGQNVTVEVRLENPESVAGAQFRLLYDPLLIQLILDQSEDKGVNTAWEMQNSVLHNGSYPTFGTIDIEEGRPEIGGKKGLDIAVSGQAETTASGQLIRLEFKAADSLPPGITTGLVPDLFFNQAVLNGESVMIPFLYQVDASAPFDPYEFDMDGDFIVDPNDARLIVRSVVGLQALTPMQIAKADVNGDGRIDLIDARILLRRIVGLE